MRILITGSGFIGELVRKLLFEKDFFIFNIDKFGYAVIIPELKIF